MSSNAQEAARVLPTDTPERFAAAVAEAAALLRAGRIVALPTETVYGLAANALDADAVARIYEAKGRPAHNPIIVHVDGVAMAKRCVRQWPEVAATLAAAFWPGPLTLVLPRAASIPDIVTANGPTVGVRWPRHPFMQALIEACGFPLAAPSANPSNHISPTTAAHVSARLGGRIPLIIDGGDAVVGIESTVVDLTSGQPRVLRPGMISEADLLAQAALVPTSATSRPEEPGPPTLRSPGMLKKHYAPHARMVLCGWENEADLFLRVKGMGGMPGSTRIVAHQRVPASQAWRAVHPLPADPLGYARLLYATLHAADQRDTALIVVEPPPADPAWKAVADRLRRAAVA